ncbi:cytochrome P450 [Amycolatopsis saalfeldensis]|uniref:Cytochrome P450 n=1 Tax=Amycolatopsis saalfeldensis TaxID=394193 RepID=A0A1H8VVT6_9PSEU|nr:cytochrome P450 [Amycolatopsis saalfeldensis]SEP19501.1 Cytochrome P450 [Amycolatopsis saalfeldensis]
MVREFPELSLPERVVFTALQIAPNTLAGLFSQRDNLVKAFDSLGTEVLAARLLAELRAAHPGDALWARVLGDRTLLVFGEPLLREVLDRSGDDFASDPAVKLRGMSHFQPGALTISHGEKWRVRRAFADAALSPGSRVHPLAPQFFSVVRREIAVMKEGARAYLLDWGRFEETVERIARQVIFGSRARDDGALTAALHAMMAEANQVNGLRKSRHFDPFYRRVAHYVRAAEPGSLVSRLPPAPEEVSALTQVTHWVFAMSGTLAANVFRTLAAISGQPALERQVRGELRSAPLTTASDVDGLKHLESCLHESMRLWPTTPMFGRRATAATTLGGVPIPAGTPVLVVNSFNHRDPVSVPDPDAFVPLRQTGIDYRFNQFGNGRQGCPGRDLAVFLAKAILAELLTGCRFVEQARSSLVEGGPMPVTLNHFLLCFAMEPVKQIA